jgi:type IV secretory pathway TraG/TraD family ATPase VirD4
VLGEIWDLYYKEYLPNWINSHRQENKKKKQLDQTSSSSDHKQRYLDAQSLIQSKLDTIIKSIAPVNEAARDKFFDLAAQSLIKLYFLLPLDYGIERQDYTLFNVSSNSIYYEQKMIILNDMLPQWGLSKYYSAQFKGGTGNRASMQDVQSTANSKLETFINQEIKNLTTPNEASIDFDKFIKEPTVLYISIDVTIKDSSANKIAVLFMELLYAYLQNYLTKNNLTYFEKPILFIIDEFGNLPKMEYMLRMFSLDQGKNVIPHLVLQSPAQLNKTYGKEQRNELFASTQCFILTSGVDDPEFARWLSKRGGVEYRKTVGRNITDEGKISHSENKQRMQNISEEEFSNIQPNQEIVIVPIGLRPCKIKYISAEHVE